MNQKLFRLLAKKTNFRDTLPRPTKGFRPKDYPLEDLFAAYFYLLSEDITMQGVADFLTGFLEPMVKACQAPDAPDYV